MARTDFETPVIFGALCEGRPEAPRGVERRLRAAVPNAVLLPFQVESKHLKNVLRCMQLMDVEGLVVLGGHRKRLKRHLASLDASARAAGAVDVVARCGKGFRGFCAEEIARSEKPVKGRKTAPRPASRGLAQKAAQISVGLLTGRILSK